MKIKVDVVSGFLGSGKTSLIKQLIEKVYSSEEKIVVWQKELGIEQIIQQENIELMAETKEKTIELANLQELISTRTPDWLVIEHNGMEPLAPLMRNLEDRSLRKKLVVNTVYHLIDVTTWDLYLQNAMGQVIQEQIKNSQIIVLLNLEQWGPEKEWELRSYLHSLNPAAEVRDISALLEEKKTGQNSLGNWQLFVFGFVLLFLASQFLRNIDWSFLVNYSGSVAVFLSILLQAFPFLLLGTLVSALIQIFFAEEKVKDFLASKGGNLKAAFLGLFFPVCDCATIPVAGSLLKKGVGLSTALTFMLAAPIVNPITLLSTWYAFPNFRWLVVYRVVLGIVVALTAGWILEKIFKNSVLLSEAKIKSCSCQYCRQETGGWLSKLGGMLEHAALEFLKIGKYLVLAAFFSTLIYTFLPPGLVPEQAQGGESFSLFLMMGLGFIFSLCSTSDAFVARTFVQQFSLGSILGFLVLGPMLDLKNIFLLSGIFKKKFIWSLVLVIWLVAFIFLTLNSLIFLR